VDRGCRAMSGLIGPLFGRSRGTDDWPDCRRHVRDAVVMVPPPFTPCTDARKTSPKLPFPPFFGMFGAASGLDRSPGKALQDHEIGQHRCWAWHPRTEWVEVHRNCHTDFPRIVHYP
jgi:hypothetical protein